jgi:hypothetical protein
MKSLTKIKTDGEVYNLILQWIKDNRDKFADYDFTGVPDSTFVSLDRSNVTRKYQLISWIPMDNLKKRQLLKNPNAIEFFKKNRDMIEWNYLSQNPNAIELLRERFKEEKNMNQSELYDLPDSKKLDWGHLSANPCAIELLNLNPKEINFNMLSANTNAIELLKDAVDAEENLTESELEDLSKRYKIDWYKLSANPNAIEILKANRDNIEWDFLSQNTNPVAIELLKANFDYIDWDYLSANPAAIDILKANPGKINWRELSKNPSAIELLRKHPEKINWIFLSLNPNAIELLQENEDKIKFKFLSKNPNAIKLLKKYRDKINWVDISENPNIFELAELTNKTFETVEDIKRWCKDPEIHPLNGSEMPAMSKTYYDIYVRAYKIMKKNGTFSEEDITGLFPKNHLLFGDIDLIYYTCVEKNDPSTYLKNCKYNNTSGSILYELLTEKMEFFENEDTVIDTEIEILRHRFNDGYGRRYSQSNMETISDLINDYTYDMINTFFDTNYISTYDYPEIIKNIKLINVKGYGL